MKVLFFGSGSVFNPQFLMIWIHCLIENMWPVQIPKLVYQELCQNPVTYHSAVSRGVCRESFQKYFNIYSPERAYRSIFSKEDSSSSSSIESGTFGFTRLMDLSPSDVSFLGGSSFMEQLMFSLTRWDQQLLDQIMDFLMESVDDDPEYNYLGSGKVRAVTRMLLMPSRTVNSLVQSKFATGPDDAPFQALVVSHHDRLLSNIRLLHSAYTFIPQARAPPVCLIYFFLYSLLFIAM